MWIHNLYKNSKKKWLYAFLISDLPMLLILTPYLAEYWNLLWAYPVPRLVSILLCGIWTWLGPYLILRWFDLFEDFLSKIDSLPVSNGTAQKVYQTKIRHNIYGIIISTIWVVSVISILILPSGRQNLATYYLYGFKDINYWIFVICVGYIAHFTAAFILFMIYSGLVIQAVVADENILSCLLKHTGKCISMSLIGDLIARTSVYFCSGFLFFPIMIIFYLETQNVSFNTSAAVFVLMGIFLAMIGVYVGIMNWIVREKAQSSKDKIMDNLEAKLNQIASSSKRCKKTNRLILYALSEQTVRQQLCEASKICTKRNFRNDSSFCRTYHSAVLNFVTINSTSSSFR